jgi:hypothetical protein
VLVRLSLAVFLAVSAVAQSKAPPNPALFHQVDEMVTALSQITGWSVERKVPASMLSNDTFRAYVESRMKETSSSEDLRIEELTLKMFGYIPQDFNLAKETVDLVSEQAAAFYDYRKKRLFVLDSTAEGSEQRVALVHELAHALADQHHPLGKYLHKGSPDDDASTARQAVMEGQATWLTWAYVASRNGGKADVPPAMIEQLTKTLGAESTDFPVFAKAPLYLRESLVFPYNEGLKFQDAVFHKVGRNGFDLVFNRPPLTSQQILHPELYFENQKPSQPKPQTREALFNKIAKQFRDLGEGSIGEFDFSMLLRQFVPQKEGSDAASHWRGGEFKLYEHKHDKYPVLSFASDWDSPASARRFFDLYQRVMKGKWKHMESTKPSEADSILTLEGRGDSGKFRLTLTGSHVESIEGLH